MNHSFDWLKQYHLLAIVLTLIFGASAVLITFERIQNQEAAQFAQKALNPSTQAVQGESIVSDKSLVAYQNYAQATAGSIQTMVKALESGTPVDPASVSQLADSLLQTKVPLPYQALHFKLLKLVRNLGAATGEDLNFLQEQLRLLSDDYPWLFPAGSGG